MFTPWWGCKNNNNKKILLRLKHRVHLVWIPHYKPVTMLGCALKHNLYHLFSGHYQTIKMWEMFNWIRFLFHHYYLMYLWEVHHPLDFPEVNCHYWTLVAAVSFHSMKDTILMPQNSSKMQPPSLQSHLSRPLPMSDRQWSTLRVQKQGLTLQ